MFEKGTKRVVYKQGKMVPKKILNGMNVIVEFI